MRGSYGASFGLSWIETGRCASLLEHLLLMNSLRERRKRPQGAGAVNDISSACRNTMRGEISLSERNRRSLDRLCG